MDFDKSNITPDDFLTVLRELKIVRDENIALKEKNIDLKQRLANKDEQNAQFVNGYQVAKKAFRLCAFLINGKNQGIALQALKIIEAFNQERVSKGLPPFEYEIKPESSIYTHSVNYPIPVS